jgi:hypothetical protein
MKTNMRLITRVAGVVIAAALLASCYAPLANQKGHLNLTIVGGKASAGPAVTAPTTAIVMVVDSEYQATLAEMLSLVSKANHNSYSLPSSDADRLKTLGQQLSTNGLVNFGGYPVYQATLTSTTGSFDIPGIPAGKYFVKFYVLSPNASFTVQNIDESFPSLVQSQNLVFDSETYNPADPTGSNWTTNTTGQPVTVNAGQSVALNANLTTTFP